MTNSELGTVAHSAMLALEFEASLLEHIVRLAWAVSEEPALKLNNTNQLKQRNNKPKHQTNTVPPPSQTDHELVFWVLWV